VPHRYARTLRWLHWITAALIAALFALGLWIVWVPPKSEAFLHRLYNLHESTGATLWLLVLARIAIRLATRAPRLPPGTPAGVRVASRLNHLGLYFLLFTQPVIGFLDANAAGAPLKWYEAIAIPAPIGKQPDPIAHGLAALHAAGAALLAALLVLHFAGAAYHGLVRRDGVIRHMI
jgi:cytochrome b561